VPSSAVPLGPNSEGHEDSPHRRWSRISSTASPLPQDQVGFFPSRRTTLAGLGRAGSKPGDPMRIRRITISVAFAAGLATLPLSPAEAQSNPSQSNPSQSNPPQSNPPQSNPPQSNPPQSNPPQSNPAQYYPPCSPFPLEWPFCVVGPCSISPQQSSPRRSGCSRGRRPSAITGHSITHRRPTHRRPITHHRGITRRRVILGHAEPARLAALASRRCRYSPGHDPQHAWEPLRNSHPVSGC
jgi:hypothetical protein